MFNMNSFGANVFVVTDLATPKEDFGYACVINRGKDESSSLFIKVLMKGTLLSRASKFFKKGTNLFITGTLENSVYNDKNTLVLQLADFALLPLARTNADEESTDTPKPKSKSKTAAVTPDGVPF